MAFVDLMGGGPGDDLWKFCSQCSPIFTLYTSGLRASPTKIRAASSWCRVLPSFEPWDPKPDGWTQIGETTWALSKDSYTVNSGESLFVMVPHDPLPFALNGSPRAEWYLNWLDHILRELAAFRGWETAGLDDARNFCVEKRLEARFQSDWKSSPDRSMRASAELFIDENGERHVSLKAIRRDGEVIATTTKTFEPFLIDYFTWRRMARQIRWISPGTVVIDDGLQVKEYPRLPGSTELSLTM